MDSNKTVKRVVFCGNVHEGTLRADLKIILVKKLVLGTYKIKTYLSNLVELNFLVCSTLVELVI